MRLKVIDYLLKQIPYEERPAESVKLPKRKIGRYKAKEYAFRCVPERY